MKKKENASYTNVVQTSGGGGSSITWEYIKTKIMQLFGYQTKLTASDDLDTLLESGTYYFMSGNRPKNRPATAPDVNGMVEVIKVPDEMKTTLQDYKCFQNGKVFQYQRRWFNGSWGDWYQVTMGSTAMAEDLQITKTTGKGARYMAEVDGKKITFGIGGDANRGIWSNVTSKWLMYEDTDNNAYFKGKADSAVKASYLETSTSNYRWRMSSDGYARMYKSTDGGATWPTTPVAIKEDGDLNGNIYGGWLSAKLSNMITNAVALKDIYASGIANNANWVNQNGVYRCDPYTTGVSAYGILICFGTGSGFNGSNWFAQLFFPTSGARPKYRISVNATGGGGWTSWVQL